LFGPKPALHGIRKFIVVSVSKFRFESFELDPAEARLSKKNVSLTLRPKTFALLHYLLANSGHLVTRDKLCSALWPEVVVNEEGLTTCIYELREVLDDDRRTPRFVETVHSRGYRFIAPVIEVGIQGDEPHDRRHATSLLKKRGSTAAPKPSPASGDVD
jgi:DNA-binding winged helix-turn-helix (wHTH) protein